MSLSPAVVLIRQLLPSEEGGRTVHHIHERHRDDQWPSLCGVPAFDLVRWTDGSLICAGCLSRLSRLEARRPRQRPENSSR